MLRYHDVARNTARLRALTSLEPIGCPCSSMRAVFLGTDAGIYD